MAHVGAGGKRKLAVDAEPFCQEEMALRLAFSGSSKWLPRVMIITDASEPLLVPALRSSKAVHVLVV